MAPISATNESISQSRGVATTGSNFRSIGHENDPPHQERSLEEGAVSHVGLIPGTQPRHPRTEAGRLKVPPTEVNILDHPHPSVASFLETQLSNCNRVGKHDPHQLTFVQYQVPRRPARTPALPAMEDAAGAAVHRP